MEALGSMVGLSLSAISAATTLYFWLVRVRQEQPRLRVHATSEVEQVTDRSQRAQWLTAFVGPEGMSAADAAGVSAPACHYFLLSAEVVNDSLRPNAVVGVRAWLRRRDGGWQEVNAAYLAGRPTPSGPFSRLKVAAGRENGLRPVPVRVFEPDKKEPLPVAETFALKPHESTPLQLVLWLVVPFRERWFEWRRLSEQKEALAGRHATADLVLPPQVRLELRCLGGPSFTEVLTPPPGAAPGAVRTAEPPLPPLPPPRVVPPKVKSAFLADCRRLLAALVLPDGGFRLCLRDDRDTREERLSDLDTPAFAVVLHRALGVPLLNEARTRDTLLGLQRPDGGFPTAASARWALDSAAALVYSTSQALAALYALGTPPRRDPLPALAEAARAALDDDEDWEAVLGPCLARAYRLFGRELPPDLRNDYRARLARPPRHDAAWLPDTFHAVAFDRLGGAATPGADALLERALREYDRTGSWGNGSGNHYGWDRSWFAGTFLLRQLGAGRPDAARALAETGPALLLEEVSGLCWKAKKERRDGAEHAFDDWADAERAYALFGALVLCGALPVEAPRGAELLGWGHLMPPPGAAPVAPARRAA
jgi:hypothetical protein